MDTRSEHLRKYAVLVPLFVAWVAADLATKAWADESLADPFHPLPVTVGASDAGRSVGQVVAQRLGLEGAALELALQQLVLLPPAVPLSPDAPLFTADGPTAGVRGFYAFWRGPDLAPRRMDKTERRRLVRWLRLASPGAKTGPLDAAVDAHLADVTVSSWLRERLRRLDADEAAHVAATALHPIEGRAPRVDPDAPAAEGATYLVTWRRVDVLGDWFKLVYAENPGAAFGFLKSVPPRIRDNIFFGLTGVVFLVILGIIVRTPWRHRWVLLALTGILGGAAGNFVDRIRYGYVIDFLDMDLGFMHWPTYNVADIAIVIGVVVLVLDMLFNKDSPLVQHPAPDAAS